MTKSIEEQAEQFATENRGYDFFKDQVPFAIDMKNCFLEGAKARDAQWYAVVNELMAGIEFDLNYHACRTGDCPHEKQSECDKSIIDSTKELLIKADQMIKEMVVNND